MTSLLTNEGSSSPLWLTLACHELRIFGDFTTLSTTIQNLPSTLFGLLKDILQRLVREDDTELMSKVGSWFTCHLKGPIVIMSHFMLLLFSSLG